MVKIFVLDQLLAEWFIKSLLPSITEDVEKGGIVIEEKVITCAQYLDLIYTQSGTLYEKIPNATRSNFNVPPQIKDSHAGDSLICTANTHHTTASDPAPTSKINAVSFEKGKSDKQPIIKKIGK